MLYECVGTDSCDPGDDFGERARPAERNETNTPHEPFLTVQCSNTSICGFTMIKLQCHRSALRSFNNSAAVSAAAAHPRIPAARPKTKTNTTPPPLFTPSPPRGSLFFPPLAPSNQKSVVVQHAHAAHGSEIHRTINNPHPIPRLLAQQVTQALVQRQRLVPQDLAGEQLGRGGLDSG